MPGFQLCKNKAYCTDYSDSVVPSVGPLLELMSINITNRLKQTACKLLPSLMLVFLIPEPE
jgi:hypothetical protein